METKKYVKYQLIKRGITLLAGMPIAVVLGSVSTPATLRAFKSRNGQIVGLILSSIGSGITSTVIADKVADETMKQFAPAVHDEVKKEEYIANAIAHGIYK